MGSDPPAEPILSRHTIPVTLQRRRNELRLFLTGQESKVTNIDDTLIRNIARGHVWFQEWLTGKVTNLKDIATREGLGREYVADVVQLAFLSPAIVQAIIEGRQPAELNSRKLLTKDAIPLGWHQQTEQWISGRA